MGSCFVTIIYPGGKVLIRKALIMIAIFLSFRHPVLRTHFLLNCSGFIFQQYVDRMLT